MTMTYADKIIAFMERHCRLPGEGPGARPVPFILPPWQKDFLQALYKEDSNGNFVKTRGLLSVAKKSGKTGLMAALTLAYLAGPMNAPSARYFSVAGGNREQAQELFNAICDMIRRNPALERRLEINRMGTILHRENLCSYRALATNASGLHGIIPSLWVYDELAQAKDFKAYEAFDRAQGTTKNTHGIVISTMAEAPDNPMAKLVRSIQEGQKNGLMQHWHVAIYQADPSKNIYDLENVRKANPSMGHFLSEEAVLREIDEAKAMESRRAAYMAYRLNLDAGIEHAFINPMNWSKCGWEINRDDLIGHRCYGGLDLSSSQDLTAFALYFPDLHVLICDAWMPKDRVAEREQEDHAPYRAWADDGWLHLCEGPVVDKEQVMVHIQEACRKYKIDEIRYDSWRIKELKAEAAKNGWSLPPMAAFVQGFKSFGPAIDELERLVLSSELRHEDSPVLNMCVRNTRGVIDPRSTNKERRPEKVSAHARIDCAVASLMACAVSEDDTRYKTANDYVMTELYA